MKKVINITIGKRIFWIEEDAYTYLQKYLEGIEKHFKKEDVSGEITEDIEYSISDKLNERKKNSKDAVEYKDIEKVISELGTIEELKEEDDTRGKESSIEEETKGKRELYRNGDNRIIAGVASGIANYFGIDPVITRVLFFISIFANGLGILIYIVLWIIIPRAKTASQKLSMKGEATNLESIEKYFEEKTKKKYQIT